MRYSRGFTLVELLVCLGIIGVLTAILFPHFNVLRGNAQRMSCMANEMQLAHALTGYAQDYDETLPCGKDQNTFTNNLYGPGWAGALLPYLKNPALFQCPSAVEKICQDHSGDPINYAYNFNLANGSTSGGAVKLSDFTSTARTVLLAECQGAHADLKTLGESSSPVGNGVESLGLDHYATGPLGGRPNHFAGYDSGRFPAESARHAGGSNFVMADGHVQWLYGQEVSSGVSAVNATDDEGTGGLPNGYAYAAGANFSGASSVTGKPFVATYSWK